MSSEPKTRSVRANILDELRAALDPDQPADAREIAAPLTREEAAQLRTGIGRVNVEMRIELGKLLARVRALEKVYPLPQAEIGEARTWVALAIRRIRRSQEVLDALPDGDPRLCFQAPNPDPADVAPPDYEEQGAHRRT